MGNVLAVLFWWLFVGGPIGALAQAIIPSVDGAAVTLASLPLWILLVASDQNPHEVRTRKPTAVGMEETNRDHALSTSYGYSAPYSSKIATAPLACRTPVSEEVRWRVFHRDNMRCCVCGSDSRLTVDHIHPVSLGGTNDESNLRTLCRSCNARKGARFI